VARIHKLFATVDPPLSHFDASVYRLWQTVFHATGPHPSTKRKHPNESTHANAQLLNAIALTFEDSATAKVIAAVPASGLQMPLSPEVGESQAEAPSTSEPNQFLIFVADPPS
jgi:hypothetical protein